MNPLYLTFDDGPSPASTDQVLDVLAKLNVQATFFLVAKKAQTEKTLAHKIVSSGNTIGNHSLDHRYGVYFQGRRRMLAWVRAAEDMLVDITGQPTIGFRPPAGVRTPELSWALRELNLPMIMWDVRFYDAVWKWGSKRALRSLQKTKPGSIVLLHDAQKLSHLSLFLSTLEEYITAGRALGFEWRPLERK